LRRAVRRAFLLSARTLLGRELQLRVQHLLALAGFDLLFERLDADVPPGIEVGLRLVGGVAVLANALL
jgi:hypothetical protein